MPYDVPQLKNKRKNRLLQRPPILKGQVTYAVRRASTQKHKHYDDYDGVLQVETSPVLESTIACRRRVLQRPPFPKDQVSYSVRRVVDTFARTLNIDMMALRGTINTIGDKNTNATTTRVLQLEASLSSNPHWPAAKGSFKRPPFPKG